MNIIFFCAGIHRSLLIMFQCLWCKVLCSLCNGSDAEIISNEIPSGLSGSAMISRLCISLNLFLLNSRTSVFGDMVFKVLY